MRVRAFLPFGVCAVTGVLHEGGSLAELAVGEHGEGRDAAPGIVRHQHELSGLVDRDVAGVGAARRDFIQERQLTGRVVDGECADAAAVRAFVVANFIHRVEETAVGARRHKRRVRGFRGQAEGRDLRRRGVIAVGVDAFAFAAFLGVGADVEKVFAFCRGCGGGDKRRENDREHERDCTERIPEIIHGDIETHSAALAQA